MVLNKKDFFRDVDSADKERIHSEQVAIAFKQAFASLFPLFFGASVVLFLFYKTPLSFAVILWFSVVMVTLFWRFWLLREYRLHSQDHDTKTWERRFKYVMYTSASLWGSSAFFLFQTSDQLHQFFLIFLLTGIASVASGTLASVLAIIPGKNVYLVSLGFLVLSAVLLFPILMVMFFQGGFEFQMMGVLVGAFFFLLASASKRIHTNIMNALKSKILHQKALEALELSEEHFEMIFKEAPTGIFYYDLNLIVINSNLEMMKILQINEEQMIGLDLKKLPDTCLHEAITSAIKGEKGYYEGAYTSMVMKLNLWITFRTSPMYNAQREIIGGVAIVTDITERIHAEEKIKRAKVTKETKPGEAEKLKLRAFYLSKQ